MSTILDALRKVERETAQLAQQPSSLPEKSLAKILVKKRSEKTFPRSAIAIALLFLVGTGVTITLGNRLFSSKDHVSLPKVAEVPRKNKESNPPAVSERQREDERKPASVMKKPDPEPGSSNKREAPLTLAHRNEAPLIAADRALHKAAPPIPAGISSPIEASKREAIIPDLELQAIVWSEDPESRSAMINGRLVRLGWDVGGFTVDEIGRNYVSVKSGFRTAKLRMIGAN